MRTAGFTLPELLVAVALLAIVSLLAYRGLDGVQRSVLRAEQGANHWRELARGVDRLAAELRQARPNAAQVGADLHLIGEPGPEGDRVTLVRRPPRAGQPAQRLGLQLSEGRLQMLAWTTARDVSPPQVDTLFEGVERLELRYLDSDGQWSERWPPPAATPLPRAVQLRLRWRDGLDLTRVVAL